MSEVLVYVDHVDGAVSKPTTELLTIARRLGEPSAVFVGTQVDAAKEALASFGAEKIYVLDDPSLSEYLVAPKSEALAQLVTEKSPAAVLLPSSAEGKEIGGRVAIRTDSGLITDATDVQDSGDGVTTTQGAFAGNYTVQATVTKGTPIVAVKPNSVAPEQSSGAGAVEQVSVTISDAALTAK